LLDEHALSLEVRADRAGNVHVEAGWLAVGGLEREGLVGWIDRNLEFLVLRSGGKRDCTQGEGEDELFMDYSV